MSRYDSGGVRRHVPGRCRSLRAALAAPDRVRALILIDTQAGAEHEEKVELYRDMLEAWASVGPGDQLAEIVSGITIDDEALNAR